MIILKRECDFFEWFSNTVERIETVYSPESSTWMWSLLEGPEGIFSFSSDDPPMSMPPFLLIDKEGVEGGGGLVFGSFQRAKLPNMLPLLERPIPAPAKKSTKKTLQNSQVSSQNQNFFPLLHKMYKHAEWLKIE